MAAHRAIDLAFASDWMLNVVVMNGLLEEVHEFIGLGDGVPN